MERDGLIRREFPETAVVAGGVTLPADVAHAQDAKLGAQLIGKLEGPELVLDPARWPKKFAEAPALAELVKAGKLPPVEKRVPDEPMVVKPVHGNFKA